MTDQSAKNAPNWDINDRFAQAARLKNARETRGLSQRAAAEYFGISPRTLRAYEMAERFPDSETLLHYANLGFSIHWLITGKGPERVNSSWDFEPLPQTDVSVGSSHLVRGHVLTIALELAHESSDDLEINPQQFAELTALIYNALTNDMPRAQVLKFSVPAAKNMAKGRMDAARSGLDESNSADTSGLPSEANRG